MKSYSNDNMGKVSISHLFPSSLLTERLELPQGLWTSGQGLLDKQDHAFA